MPEQEGEGEQGKDYKQGQSHVAKPEKSFKIHFATRYVSY